MAKVLSCQPLTVQAWVKSQASPRGPCGGKGGTVTGLSLSTLFSCVSVILLVSHTPSATDAI
jgi:hypothetical protein